MGRLTLTLALLLVMATTAMAQSTIRRGTPLYFDHDEQSLVITEKYQLCEDVVTDETCMDIEVVRLNGTLTFQFALPGGVRNGLHAYALRAFGDKQWSDPSEPTLTLKVTGKPLPPYNHRTTGPDANGINPGAPPPAAPQSSRIRMTP